MPAPSSCPDLQELERFARGQVHVADAERFHEHFDGCPRCVHVLQALESELEQKGSGAEALAGATRIVTAPEPAPPPSVLAAATVVRTPATSPVKPVEVYAAPDPSSTDATQAVIAVLAPAREADEIGRLGPYRILKVLGSGATGVVFQAQDVQLRRTVALKAMKPSPEGGEVARQRFLREARAAAALEHDHVVTIYQVGEDRGLPYLAMQLLQGETLDSLLRRESRLPIPEILRISREIAEGLAAAHDEGVIHRDIKPANIWLEKRPGGAAAGRVKLVDFGLARAASDDEQLTKTGTILGTPAYMAPEQARAAEVDPRADLFSLGCVIYRMVTGQLPFHADDTMGMLLAVASDDPKPMRTFNPEVPDALVGLVNRLLAKNPIGRPASAREVVGTLRDIEDIARGRSTIRSVNRRVANPNLPGPKKSGKGLAVALVGLVLVAAAAGTWFRAELLRWVNNRGLVEIDSNAKGTLQLTIKSKDGGFSTSTSSRQIELDAGEYVLEGAAGSKKLAFQPKEITVTRGGHKVVKAFEEKPDAHGSRR